jgi:hypothetical protein
LIAFLGEFLPYFGRLHWVLAPIALGAIVYTGLIWRKAGTRSLAEGFGLAAIVGIVTSYYANDYDLLILIVPLLAMCAQPYEVPSYEVPKADRVTRYLEATGLLFLLFTPVYWFVRAQLQAECLMILPLLALAVALARRLIQAHVDVSAERRVQVLEESA